MKDPLGEVVVRPRRVVPIILAVLALIVVGAILRPGLTATIAVVASLLVMIFLHELGHFVMAKRAGMKVTEFFVGFGPRLWSVRRGETEYGVKAFPLGGYCRIVGMSNLEEIEPEDEPRTYRSKAFHQKLGVAVAGSFTHFVIALVLVFLVLWQSGDPFDDRVDPSVTNVQSDSAAAAAGIEPGDDILAVDGEPVSAWEDVVAAIQASPDEPVSIVVDRGGERLTLEATPTEREVDGETIGYLGVSPRVYTVPLSLPEAAPRSFVVLGRVARLNVEALGEIFSPSGIERYFNALSGSEAAEDQETRFVSPVGITRVAGEAVRSGWVDVLLLLVAVNVFVGIFNMIPLLPFDGGYVAIAIYEKIASTVRHRPVQADVRKLLPITVAVVTLLVFIGLSALFLDIVNPLRFPS
ncbi:MAG: site-2 protease family protein [Acidimicrobiia bacterium]|nr:site-2 protease family protein [Acidimicrobiia bacterium]